MLRPLPAFWSAVCGQSLPWANLASGRCLEAHPTGVALAAIQSRSGQSVRMETRQTHPVPVHRTSHSPLKSPCFFLSVHIGTFPFICQDCLSSFALPINLLNVLQEPSYFTNIHGGTITGNVLSAGLSELSISFGN